MACTDEQYLQLHAEFKENQARYLAMFSGLEEQQQDILMDYLGSCIFLHIRLLELACAYFDPPEK